MKKNLLILTAMLSSLFLTGDLVAQTYHFQEGFVTNAPPVGWIATNVGWSSNYNHGAYPGDYSAKLKPNESFLMFKALNTADILDCYIQVRDTIAADSFHLLIEKSYNQLDWIQVSKDPCNMLNDSVFQHVSITVADPAIELYLRFHAVSVNGTNTLGLCYVDDISVTKLAFAPDDATLSDLTYNGISLEGFVASDLEYELEVPYYVDQVVMGGTPNNPAASMTISNPTNLRGNEAARTGTVSVTSQDGTVTKAYKIIFTVSDYIYKAGFILTGDGAMPFDGWDGSYTYTSNTIPMGNHGDFEGLAALKFVRGQVDKPGYLMTAKYIKSDTLTFWLAVDQPDGVEALLIQKKVLGGVNVILANITSAQMTFDWQKFTYFIGEDDSTQIIFTPTLTAEGVTRIWIDDIAMKGKKVESSSVSENNSATYIPVFPNPAHDVINLQLPDPSFNEVVINDLTGRRMLTQEICNSLVSVDISNLPKGIYFITLSGTTRLSAGKFIKY